MKIYYIAFFLLFSEIIIAQKTTLTFTADKDCEIILYEPVDGEYNTHVPSAKFAVNEGEYAIYETNLASYTFIYCQFLQYQESCNIILFPNDSIQISIIKDQIAFQGNNNEGNQFLYDHFQKKNFFDEILKMQKIILEYIEQKRDFQSIFPTIDDSLHISSIIKQIEELPSKGNTTSNFAKVLKTNTYMLFNAEIVDMMKFLLLSIEKHPHIVKDSVHINNVVKSIYNKVPISLEIQKYSSLLYILKYLSFYYDKKKCPEGYDPETFGPYKQYLYAPKDMQPGLLGGACMVQLKYNSGEMNLSKLKKFFNEKFPRSAYAAIIDQKVQEKTDLNNETPNNSYFINESIDSLSQFSNQQELKGKYLFIDLWASWCMPCRAEFSYKSKLEELLDTYSNIVAVYISIDGAKQEKAWRNCIDYYKLKGFHLRATSALQENIKKEIYKEKKVEIPRYILIGPEGKILNNDLPRPSKYPQLKEALEKVIK